MRSLRSFLFLLGSGLLCSSAVAHAQSDTGQHADENAAAVQQALEFTPPPAPPASSIEAFEQPLPPGAVQVRDRGGVYQAPYAEQESCSGDWCGTTVVNMATGEVIYAYKQWQAGAVETGYGEEVIFVPVNPAQPGAQ